jgi:hypothetical protein
VEHRDLVTGQNLAFEQRLRPGVAPTPELPRLRTLPGVGWVLAVGLGLEIGASARFPRAAPRAASAGTTPRVHASGGRIRSGPLRGTSTVTSSGPASKRRAPSASIARSGRTGTSVVSLRASSSGRATRRRSGPSRATWPRPASGS